MSGRIYIASKPVAGSIEHLYLVFDPNANNDNLPSGLSSASTVIRGGPQFDLPPFQAILLEVGKPLDESEDSFGADTPGDRNITVLNIGTQDHEVVFQAMVAFGSSSSGRGLNHV